MFLDTAHFTPYTALAGGALIGVGAGVLMLTEGRIAGISGILAGLLSGDAADRRWRASFVAGLCLAGLLLPRLGVPLNPEASTAGGSGHWLGLAAAGLLVGIGTRYGGGCTSGHGVCGLARGSLRSLVATLSFMATGMLTVALLRHVLS